MTIVFYIRAIPDDLRHGSYDSPLVSVNIPYNWRGTDAEALDFARKVFKEQMGRSDIEFGASYKFE
jgi:hypothetical protein